MIEADAAGWLTAMIARIASVPVGSLPACAQSALRVDEPGFVLFLPLLVRDEILGAVVLQTQAALPADMLDALGRTSAAGWHSPRSRRSRSRPR